MARKKDARAVRRNLVIRQAAVYLLLVSGLAVVGVAGWGMFTGRVTPWFWMEKDFSAKPSPTLNEGPEPCPLTAESVYPEPSQVRVTVLNASGKVGAAGAGARVLEELGFKSAAADATDHYIGGIKVVAGLAGVDNAYAVLKVLPQSTVLAVDHRQDASVDVVLGDLAESFPAPAEVKYEAKQQIQPVKACQPANSIIAKLKPTVTVSPSSVA